ncbi:MAG: DUF4097 family beta strand repeat protein [Firmicutes bacterium]|nr:DUF4097 family beta strand repeat protein [Bacillota bacterium]
MKSSAVIRVIIWSVVAIILAWVLCWGLWLHGGGSLLGNKKTGASSEAKSSGNVISSSESFEGQKINKVKVEWVAGSIQVESGDAVSFEVNEPENLKDEQRMSYKIDGDTLIIQEYSQSWNFSLGFNLNTINNYASKNLKLVIPAGLEELKIETVSADVDLRAGIVVEELEVEAVSADINVDEISARKIEFETVSGDMTVSLAKAAKKIKGNTVSGELTVYVSEDIGFTAETESVSGDTNVNMSVTNHNDKIIHGDGDMEIELNSVSGDMNIYKK